MNEKLRDRITPSTEPIHRCALIVDDDPGDLLLTQHVLKLSGCFDQVLTANSADEALRMLSSGADSKASPSEQIAPDVIFLDVWMPRKTGHDFLEEFTTVRDRDRLNSAVVAMLTSSENEEDRRRAAAYDFVVDYLIKPLQVSDVEPIRNALHQLSKAVAS